MSDIKNIRPRKVVDEHESKSSHVRIGHCPQCHAVMSYHNSDIDQCLCCGVLIEWDIKN